MQAGQGSFCIILERKNKDRYYLFKVFLTLYVNNDKLYGGIGDDIYIKNIQSNSSIIESRATRPIKYLGSKGFCKFNAVWILTTPPTKNDINATIPKDRIIKSSISLKINIFSTGHLVNFLNVLPIIKKYNPM